MALVSCMGSAGTPSPLKSPITQSRKRAHVSQDVVESEPNDAANPPKRLAKDNSTEERAIGQRGKKGAKKTGVVEFTIKETKRALATKSNVAKMADGALLIQKPHNVLDGIHKVVYAVGVKKSAATTFSKPGESAGATKSDPCRVGTDAANKSRLHSAVSKVKANLFLRMGRTVRKGEVQPVKSPKDADDSVPVCVSSARVSTEDSTGDSRPQIKADHSAGSSSVSGTSVLPQQTVSAPKPTRYTSSRLRFFSIMDPPVFASSEL